ncbi:hypothetical protein CONPUDRAFT_73899 [Coniophora puteana RWD-64-598 SS2]|uniref:DUF6534 domain-containing protein n=1 Tax=Coniophora puteana (strain RWD-64-598) TaxID=741705 RepID=A0A5M3MJN4_CONPW|nr:uncharacterized protein CONPUDRAFT_73899 [Coniophora puteana RWD-64-598 SS2]EIW79459.1 hypothetical protein CONPUDRAFT_73899 [Coniophora puteana RWD-64-598 SS2]
MAFQCNIPSNILEIVKFRGNALNWILYGVLMVQLYKYHVSPFSDSYIVRTTVYSAFTAETVQMITSSRDAFGILVSGWGCSDAVFLLYTEFLSEIILPSLIGAIVECSYAWRIYIVSGSVSQTTLVVLFSTATVSGIRADTDDSSDNTKVPSDVLNTITLWSVAMAVCDIVIFGLMTYHLSRRRTGVRKTDKLIDGLVKVIVETGMASAIMWLLFFSLLVGFKQKHYYAVPVIVGSKVYCNSLLVILNNRKQKDETRLLLFNTKVRSRFQPPELEAENTVGVPTNALTRDRSDRRVIAFGLQPSTALHNPKLYYALVVLATTHFTIIST